jgi:alkylhydroperoxidase family enzyme
MAYIQPPKRFSPILRFGIWLSERITGEEMLPARLLAWYPKAAVSSAVMESLVAHDEGIVSRRMLKLVRMQVSFSASCPFCIDMNSFKFAELNISDEEIEALQGLRDPQDVASFTKKERLALAYAKSGTSTPLTYSAKLIAELKKEFSEREIVILATTIAQVNYWTRLIQSLGVPPSGFSSDCTVLRVDEYNTLIDSDDFFIR